MPDPQLETALDSSAYDYTGVLTDSIIIITSVNFLPDTKYYMRAYAIDEFEQVIPGQQVREYDPFDPAHNPIACFAANQSICEVGNCSVNFDADCSMPENFITTYKWDIDGDDFNDYTGADKQSISHTYDEAGTYTVKLEVLAKSGITDDTTYVIQVNESTDTLLACFNMSKTECNVGDCTVNFDASCSANANSYKWDFDGDGVFNAGGIDKQIVSHTYDVAGTYDVKLEVENTNEDTKDTILTIQVNQTGNTPIACFSMSQTECDAGCFVSFNASCSQNATNYKWDVDGDGIFDFTGSDKQTIEYTYNVVGTYNVKLEILNSNGVADNTIRIIQVNEPDNPPFACFNMSKTECNVDDCVVSFDASCSQNETEYKWDFDGDGISDPSSGEIEGYTYTTPGTYNVRLIVEDNNDNADTTFQTIQVYDITADFDISDGTIYEDCEVVFTNNSTGATSYFWDFGDGNTSTEENPIYTYGNTGTYTVSLTATMGGIDVEDTQSINITSAIKFETIRDIGSNDAYQAVIILPDGDYIIVGYTDSQGAGENDIYLAKTDANGNVQWEKTFGGSNGDVAYSIVSASDGGYVITGMTVNQVPIQHFDVYLIKTDANGNIQWEKTFDGGSNDIANSIVSVSNGGYVIAGITDSQGAGSQDVYLIKIDANGNMQWGKTFGGNGIDRANSIISTPDGGYVIAGETNSQGAGSYDGYLIKTDANGNMQWEKTFGGNGIYEANAIIPSHDVGYVITGYTESQGTGAEDVYLMKTDANGNMEWEKTFGSNYNDIAYAVKATGDCGYFIGGQHYNGSNFDFYLIKTDSEGNAQ